MFLGRTSSASRYRRAHGTRSGTREPGPRPTRGTCRSDSAHVRSPSGCRGPTAPRRRERRTGSGADPAAHCRGTSAVAGHTGCTERQRDGARRAPSCGAVFCRETRREQRRSLGGRCGTGVGVTRPGCLCAVWRAGAGGSGSGVSMSRQQLPRRSRRSASPTVRPGNLLCTIRLRSTQE